MTNVRCGLDRLSEYAGLLAGKRLGLLTTPAAVTGGGEVYNADGFLRRGKAAIAGVPEVGGYLLPEAPNGIA